MIALDHLIVRALQAEESARFYVGVLGFVHEGRRGPFEALRVNDGLVLDLLEGEVREPMHLAFRLAREEFEVVHRRLLDQDIPFGAGPFDRDGKVGRTLGARGTAEALYFHDPDRHSIEIRLG